MIKKYIENKIVITIAIIVVLAIVIILYFSLKNNLNYKIADYFLESSPQGKIVFVFVEVEDLNPTSLNSLSKYIMENHNSMFLEDDSLLLVMVAHFYNKHDTINLPGEVKEEIRMKYPDKPDIEDNLYYIPKGFVYTGFSRKVEGLDVPKDTLFQTPILIPKPGIKAKDVIKPKRIF